MSRWEAYDAWNEAIAEVFFSEELGGQPVYIDVDSDTIPLLGEKTGTPSDEVEEALATAVREVLCLAGSRHTFGEILTHLTTWLGAWRRTAHTSRPTLSPPPILALLAVFSMAAERMGRDADMGPNNYFGRLAQLLGARDQHEKQRLKAHYRQHVVTFWNVLATWLTGLDGMRGLPSAVAISHRYIGLSISQALVREHDRSKLPRFFADYGLHPGQEVAPQEMQPLLDEWIRRDPPPISKNLASLWIRHAATRERIASVVSLELQNWDGSSTEVIPLSAEALRPRGEVRLVALTRSSMFGSSLELSVVARIPGPAEPHCMQIDSAIGDDKPVLELMPWVNGWHRLPRPAGLEKSSILDGVLVLSSEDGKTVQRRPRRVVPLRKDETLGLFLEVERLQLAEDGLVFASNSLAGEVADVLKHVARPGFQRVQGGSEGVPAGWVLFRDVQILGLLPSEARSRARADVNVLLPSVSSQVAFSEGLKLPGRLRKFSAYAPPEIRAVSTGAEHIRLQVARRDAESIVGDVDPNALERVACEREGEGAALILHTADEHLPVGDYEALLFVDGANDPTQRLPFLLRSADSVDLAMWTRCRRLAHQPAVHQGWAALSAEPYEEESSPVIDGAVATEASPLSPAVQAPRSVWWTQQRPTQYGEVASAVLTTPDARSCLVTGAHYYELPYASTSFVSGVCRNCGLVKRFPNNHWAAQKSKRARDKVEAMYRVDVHDVEPVRAEPLTWDVGLDGLMHAGGGPISALEGIALQIEGSLLFVDTFTRTLEALAHIAVRRDERTLEAVEWEIAPPALAQLADGAYLLTGYWPPSYVETLEELAAEAGAKVGIETTSPGPSRRTLSGLAPKTAQELASAIGDVTVAADAARAILRAAPDLTAVEASLPTITMPGARRIQHFHLGSAAWVPQRHAETLGAFRLESFGSTYIVRRDVELANGTARVGTAQLVKHLEALRAGRPLLAYDPAAQALDVPLGADLPGLYGRAAVLCAGRPPAPIKERRLLRYYNVPADVADMLATRLAR
ncbi:hypothetical protein [Micromonospora chalcea]|uniref:hypothetical protein n=1 Tax=Micromonospora chalcea TaxID=1874 RepID=UPI00157D5F77|nr:hypothetical protein [Micromonospora chalcea]